MAVLAIDSLFPRPVEQAGSCYTVIIITLFVPLQCNSTSLWMRLWVHESQIQPDHPREIWISSDLVILVRKKSKQRNKEKCWLTLGGGVSLDLFWWDFMTTRFRSFFFVAAAADKSLTRLLLLLLVTFGSCEIPLSASHTHVWVRVCVRESE